MEMETEFVDEEEYEAIEIALKAAAQYQLQSKSASGPHVIDITESESELKYGESSWILSPFSKSGTSCPPHDHNAKEINTSTNEISRESDSKAPIVQISTCIQANKYRTNFPVSEVHLNMLARAGDNVNEKCLLTEPQQIRLESIGGEESSKEEANYVKRLFLETYRLSNESTPLILKVERVTDLRRERKFLAHRAFIQDEGVDPNLCRLFHGAPQQAVSKILKQGFNRNLAGINGSVYGVGVYFSARSDYSTQYAQPDDSGVRRVLICDVLVGEFGQGSPGLRVPPRRASALDPDHLCHSTVDSIANPQIYVSYHDDQPIVRYVLSMTRRPHPVPSIPISPGLSTPSGASVNSKPAVHIKFGDKAKKRQKAKNRKKNKAHAKQHVTKQHVRAKEVRAGDDGGRWERGGHMESAGGKRKWKRFEAQGHEGGSYRGNEHEYGRWGCGQNRGHGQSWNDGGGWEKRNKRWRKND